MSKTHASRAAAGAVLSAALMAGSLSLAVAAVSAARPPAASAAVPHARTAALHPQLVPCPCTLAVCQSGC